MKSDIINMVINMNTTIPGGKKQYAGREFLVTREGLWPGEGLYEKELYTYSCVSRGDCENIRPAVETLIEEKLSSGGLDVGNLDEARYRAAEIINIAARYAAQSVCGEEYCLRFADESVSIIDKVTDMSEIYRILVEKTAELTRFVAQSKRNGDYPAVIRRAMDYINSNLSKNLSVIDVAGECGVSPDYMSAYFRRVAGIKMTAYIRRQKLLLAKDMLGKHIKCVDAAIRLSFCSESYFVKCFREEFGVTPKKWQSGTRV